jgi:hypothetical protein
MDYTWTQKGKESFVHLIADKIRCGPETAI